MRWVVLAAGRRGPLAGRLDHDQVAMLAEACGRYGLLVRFLVSTGLRWGEASALRVSRLDLLRRRVTVAVAFAEVGGELVEGTPKNHQRRSVPIPRFLVDELAAHVAAKRRDALVFTAPNGEPLGNTNFRTRVCGPAAASVGLAGLTPHDLRHTAASLAVAAGANVKARQSLTPAAASRHSVIRRIGADPGPLHILRPRALPAHVSRSSLCVLRSACSLHPSRLVCSRLRRRSSPYQRRRCSSA
ncbi:tyrosine-type recombinase/integrase [Micromonospora sp. NPDC023633]|uniref:tyrosine-type recombinase/integrase n=1 Tax=Micromonospora sp. NPDC023633 TaxID=3154320 RepID=UPI0034094774